MNLPNKITLSRILLVPVFMLFVIPIPEWIIDSVFFSVCRPFFIEYNIYLKDYGYFIATAIFIFASATDAVDGYIARKHKLVTNMGKFLDPIADKLLITAAILALVSNHSLSGWSAMIVIGREFIVTALRLLAAVDGTVIAASNIAKLKTALQMIAMGMMMFKGNLTDMIPFYFPTARIVMLFAVIVTIWSGIDYVVKNYHVITKEVSIQTSDTA